jgi:chromosome segregation ATPase
VVQKEQELTEAQRRVGELQRAQAEPVRQAKRQAEAHAAEVERVRERVEAAEVKHRAKVAELAAIKEELGASRQDAQSSDRAMRDQLSHVEERLASTTRDLQLSQLPQPAADSDEVSELRRQLSAERVRRERLLKESNERLRKAQEVMAKMRKTLERLGLMQQEPTAPLSDPVEPQPQPLEQRQLKQDRPQIPRPAVQPPPGNPTLMPEIIDAIALPKQSELAEAPEFSDDPPPIIDEG